jgi:hypothetical protein
LEILLRQDSQNLPGFSNLGQKEVIAVSCWYLWWIRQRRTHNETVPSMMNCKMSILSMVANAAKLSNPMAGQSEKWTRPAPRQVKLNVDASFYAESQDGSVGAILRDYQGQFLAASSKVRPHVA